MTVPLILLFAVFLGVLASGFVRVNEPDPPAQKACSPDCVPRQLLVRSEARSRKRLRLLGKAERRAMVYRRVMLHRPDVSEAINLACAVYGHCAELWRKARCESHLFAGAHNASGASGLFQFLPSTFASTPFGGFSIWSPYASALAAGYMHVHGRGGEWVCR